MVERMEGGRKDRKEIEKKGGRREGGSREGEREGGEMYMLSPFTS